MDDGDYTGTYGMGGMAPGTAKFLPGGAAYCVIRY
jgi:hypothetical protein